MSSYTLRDNLSPFFTTGRPLGILGLVLHHAATTNFAGIGQTFKTRGVSAGYGVKPSLVERYVYDGNIAYHAGDWDANVKYIGIEHVNSSGAPQWKIDPKTINTSISLAANLARRHGWKKLVPFKNLFPHGYFTPTFCPGVIKDMLDDYANRVNKLLGQSSSPAPKPSTSKRKSNSKIVSEVLRGLWGNGTDRTASLKKAGYNPADIQRLVNAHYGIGSAPAAKKPSISSVAKQVIAGSFGNNPQRADNLKRAGHDPAKVQAEVNRLLGVGKGRAVPAGGVFAVGQRVTVTNPVDMNGTRLGVSGVYNVMEVNGSRIVIGRSGQVTAAINKNNLRRA